ncbi:hypothetical protein [Geomonas agri]|uniref:hypothetical protein n=1 Tax=Geomonas agri TaxID=2873702 RepID=UPI001CD3629A|nr:hypothetical protein [Geomonas agri]
MDEKNMTPAISSFEPPLPGKEELLVELRWKKWVYFFTILVIILISLFYVFGVIIPYLTTGDFNEIWPAHKYKASAKVKFLLFSPVWLLLLPVFAGAFRIGVISFYETYVEQRPYLPFFKKVTIPYKALHIKEGSNGLRLTNGGVPPWFGNQFKYWKISYWDAIVISVVDMVYSNPECHPKAIEIGRKWAVKIDRS